MKKPNITPGKWETNPEFMSHDIVATATHDYRRVCSKVYIKADAEAISAVPEMIDALMGAINISELWIPDMENIPPENEGEVEALLKMKAGIEQALEKAGVEF